VTFTSGSTGEPKAALRTHAFLLAQHRVLEHSLGLRPGIRDLTTLPIFVLANLGSGVTSILPDADLRSPGAIDPRPVLSQIERHNIMTTAMSPAFLSQIVNECERNHSSIPQLKKIYLGGAPVFPRILRKAKQLCPGATITAVYGSTEAEPMAELSLSGISDDDFQRMREGHGLLAGHPVASISLRVIRDQGGHIAPLDRASFDQLATQPGEPGEIVVSGPHVLPGYFHGQGDAETKFDVAGIRWHRTGDSGYLDAEGRLWLLGRCSAKISDSRGTLYPFAVECAAMEHSAVKRAALVSLDGRRVLAIEPQSSASPENIQQLLAWAQLDRVVFIDHLPVDKRHNAKIDYVALARMLSAHPR
jgi:acyl-CoA synthetase (AMP-forming)/AMP-acid ligase II